MPFTAFGVSSGCLEKATTGTAWFEGKRARSLNPIIAAVTRATLLTAAVPSANPLPSFRWTRVDQRRSAARVTNRQTVASKPCVAARGKLSAILQIQRTYGTRFVGVNMIE